MSLRLSKLKKRYALALILGCAINVSNPRNNAYAETTQNQSLTDWLDQPTMTGDWGGVRTNLAQDGVNVYGSFVQFFGGVPSGGKNQGFDYDQQAIIGTTFDLQKLLGLDGGLFHFELNDRAGRDIGTDYVGSTMGPFAQYGAGENFRLSNMSYEQNFLNGRLNFLIGYYPSGTQFANVGDTLCAFLVNGLCGHPLSIAEDTKGEMNSPGSQWGARIKAYITPSLYNMTGLYEVNPTLTGTDYNGFKLGLVNTTGAIVFEEIGKTSHLGPSGLVGHIKIGGYYDTSTVPDVADQNLEVAGRYGGYILLDQMVYSFQPDTDRGIIIFGEATDNDKRTSLIGSYYDAGIILQGLSASRPNDTLGFAWVTNNLNKRAQDAEELALADEGDPTTLYNAEEVLELSYNLQVGPWLSIHPDMQYWIDPGSITYTHYPNAWLFGMQTSYTF